MLVTQIAPPKSSHTFVSVNWKFRVFQYIEFHSCEPLFLLWHLVLKVHLTNILVENKKQQCAVLLSKTLKLFIFDQINSI